MVHSKVKFQLYLGQPHLSMESLQVVMYHRQTNYQMPVCNIINMIWKLNKVERALVSAYSRIFLYSFVHTGGSTSLSCIYHPSHSETHLIKKNIGLQDNSSTKYRTVWLNYRTSQTEFLLHSFTLLTSLTDGNAFFFVQKVVFS